MAVSASALAACLLGRGAMAPDSLAAAVTSIEPHALGALFGLPLTARTGGPAAGAPVGAVAPPAAEDAAELSAPAAALARDVAALLGLCTTQARALVARTPGVDPAAPSFRPVHLSAVRSAHLRERLGCIALADALVSVAGAPGASGHAAAAALLTPAVADALVASVARTLVALQAPVLGVPDAAALSVFAAAADDAGPAATAHQRAQFAAAFAARHVRLLAAWRVRELVALLRLATSVIHAHGCDTRAFLALAGALHACGFAVHPQLRELALSAAGGGSGGSSDGGGSGVALDDVAADVAAVPHLAVLAVVAALNLPSTGAMLLASGGAGAGAAAAAAAAADSHPLTHLGRDRRVRALLRGLSTSAEAWLLAGAGRLPPDAPQRYSDEQLAGGVLALSSSSSGAAHASAASSHDSGGGDGGGGGGPTLELLVDAARYATGAGGAAPADDDALPAVARVCPYVPVLVAWSALLATAGLATGAVSTRWLHALGGGGGGGDASDGGGGGGEGGQQQLVGSSSDSEKDALLSAALRRVSPGESLGGAGSAATLTAAAAYLAAALPQLLAPSSSGGGRGRRGAALLPTDGGEDADAPDGLPCLLAAAQAVVARAAAGASEAVVEAAAAVEQQPLDLLHSDGGAGAPPSGELSEDDFDLDDVMLLPSEKAAAARQARAVLAAEAAASAATDAVAASPLLLREAAAAASDLDVRTPSSSDADDATQGASSASPAHDTARQLARSLLLAVALARWSLVAASSPPAVEEASVGGGAHRGSLRLSGVFAGLPGLQRSGGDDELGAVLALVAAVYAGDHDMCRAAWAGLSLDEQQQQQQQQQLGDDAMDDGGDGYALVSASSGLLSGGAAAGGGAPPLPVNEPLCRWLLDACLSRAPLQLAPLLRLVAAISAGPHAAAAAARFLAVARHGGFLHVAPTAAIALAGDYHGGAALLRSALSAESGLVTTPVYARVALVYASEGARVPLGAQGVAITPAWSFASARTLADADALLSDSTSAMPSSFPAPESSRTPQPAACPVTLVAWGAHFTPLHVALARLVQLVPSLARLPASLRALAACAGSQPAAAASTRDGAGATVAPQQLGGMDLGVTSDADGGLRSTLLLSSAVRSAGPSASAAADSPLAAVLGAAVSTDNTLRDALAIVRALTALLRHAPSSTLSAIARATGAGVGDGAPAADVSGGIQQVVTSLLRAAAALLYHALPVARMGGATLPPDGRSPISAAVAQLQRQAQLVTQAALHLLAAAAAACALVSESALLRALTSSDGTAALGNGAMAAAAASAAASATVAAVGSGTLGALLLSACAACMDELPQPLASAAALPMQGFLDAALRAAITHDARAALGSPLGDESAGRGAPVGTAASLVDACANMSLRSLVQATHTLSELRATRARVAAASAVSSVSASPQLAAALSADQAALRRHCWRSATRALRTLSRITQSCAPAAASTRARLLQACIADATLSQSLLDCVFALAAHATRANSSVLFCDLAAGLASSALSVDEQLSLQALAHAALCLLHAAVRHDDSAPAAALCANLLLERSVVGLLPPVRAAEAATGEGAPGRGARAPRTEGAQPAADEEVDMATVASTAPPAAASTGLHALVAYCSHANDVVPQLPHDDRVYLPACELDVRSATAASHSVSLAALALLQDALRCMSAAALALGGPSADGSVDGSHSTLQRSRLHFDAWTHMSAAGTPERVAGAVRALLMPVGPAAGHRALPSLGHALGVINVARVCMDGQTALLQALLHSDSLDTAPAINDAASAAAASRADEGKRVRFVDASGSSLNSFRSPDSGDDGSGVGSAESEYAPTRGLLALLHPSALELAVEVVLAHESLLATSDQRAVPQSDALRLLHGALALLTAIWRSAAEDGHFLRVIARLRSLAPLLWPTVAALCQPRAFFFLDAASADAQTLSQDDAQPLCLCVQAAAMDLLSCELLWAGPHHDASHRRHRRRSSSAGDVAARPQALPAAAQQQQLGTSGASVHALLEAVTPLLRCAAPGAASGSGDDDDVPSLMRVCGSLPCAQVVMFADALRTVAPSAALSAYQTASSSGWHGFAPKARFGFAPAVSSPQPQPPHRLATVLRSLIPQPISSSSFAQTASSSSETRAGQSRCDPAALGRRYVYDADAMAVDAGHAVEWLELASGSMPPELRSAIGAVLGGQQTQAHVLAPSGSAESLKQLQSGLHRLGCLWLVARWNGAASLLSASADAMSAWQGLLAASARVASLAHAALPPASLALCALHLLSKGVVAPATPSSGGDQAGDGEASQPHAALPPADAAVMVTGHVTATEAATVLLGAALEVGVGAAHSATPLAAVRTTSVSGAGISPGLQLRLLNAASQALARFDDSAASSQQDTGHPALRLRLLLLSLVLTIVNRLSLNSEAPVPAPGLPDLRQVLARLAGHAVASLSAAASVLPTALAAVDAAAPPSPASASVAALAVELFNASASLLARVLFLRPPAPAPASAATAAPSGGGGGSGGAALPRAHGASDALLLIGSPVPGLGARAHGGATPSTASPPQPLAPLLCDAQVGRLVAMLTACFTSSTESLAALLAAHEDAWLRRLSGLLLGAQEQQQRPSAGAAAAYAQRLPAASLSWLTSPEGGRNPALNELRSLTPLDGELPPSVTMRVDLLRSVAQLAMRLLAQLALRYTAASPASGAATGAMAVARAGVPAAIVRSSLFRRMEAALRLRHAAGLLGYPFHCEADDALPLPPPLPAGSAGRGVTSEHASPVELASALRAVGIAPALAFAATGFGLGPSPARGYQGSRTGAPERCALAATWCDALGVLAHTARGHAAAAAGERAPTSRAAADALVDALRVFPVTLTSALQLGRDVSFGVVAESTAAGWLLAAAYSTQPLAAPVDPVLAAMASAHGGGDATSASLASGTTTTSTLEMWLASASSSGSRGGGGGSDSGAGAPAFASPAAFAACGQYLVRDVSLLLGSGEGGPSRPPPPTGGAGAAPAVQPPQSPPPPPPALKSSSGGGLFAAPAAATGRDDAGASARERLQYRYGLRVVAVSAGERRAENSHDLWRRVRLALLCSFVPLQQQQQLNGSSPLSAAGRPAGAASDAAALKAAQPKSILKTAGAAAARAALSSAAAAGGGGGLVSRQGSFFSASESPSEAVPPRALGGASPTVIPMRAWRDMVEAALAPALAAGLALCAAVSQARRSLQARHDAAAAHASRHAAAGSSSPDSPGRAAPADALGVVRQLALSAAHGLAGGRHTLDASAALAGGSGRPRVHAADEPMLASRSFAAAPPSAEPPSAADAGVWLERVVPLPADIAQLRECRHAVYLRLEAAERRAAAAGDGEASQLAADAADAAAARAVAPRAPFSAWPQAPAPPDAPAQLAARAPLPPLALTLDDAFSYSGRWLHALPGPGHVLSALSFALHRAQLLLPQQPGVDASGGAGGLRGTPAGPSAHEPAPHLQQQQLRHSQHTADVALAMLAASSAGAEAPTPLTGKVAALSAVAPLSIHTLRAIARAGLQALAACVDELACDPRLSGWQAQGLMGALAQVTGDGGLECVIGGAVQQQAHAREQQQVQHAGEAPAAPGGLLFTPGKPLHASGAGQLLGGTSSPPRVSPGGGRAGGGGLCPASAAPARRSSGGGGLFRASFCSLGGGGGGGASGGGVYGGGSPLLLGMGGRSPLTLGGGGGGGGGAAALSASSASVAGSQAVAAARALDASVRLLGLLGGGRGDAGLLAQLLPTLVLLLSARIQVAPELQQQLQQQQPAQAGGDFDPIGERLERAAAGAL